ncbi:MULTISPECIES: hypothetical protein [unclassified Bradyrhizobium]|uniref:hypothetical protein n=1 Tax=Bradyrhizobium TaxID=374 RepID=UPI0028EA31DD|nr:MULTISPECIES: hypothetical protein [unclassified Bradyrhizobium]
MINWLAALIETAVHGLWTRSMTTDPRNDPVYKKNIQELIERNRRFEDARE